MVAGGEEIEFVVVVVDCDDAGERVDEPDGD